MVTIQTKEEANLQRDEYEHDGDNLVNENNIHFNYYILNIAKCKYDGELDAKQPFLKLMSISHFKKNAVFNTENAVSSFYIAF